MAGELISRDRQVEIQGLLLGPGTPYVIEEFNPWTFPEVTSGEVSRPQKHGLVGGQDLARGKRVPLLVTVDAADDAAAEDAVSALKAAFRPMSVDVPMVWQSGGRKRQIVGRPKLADPITGSSFLHDGSAQVECRFLTTDPLIYDHAEQSGSTGFPVGSGGFTFDLTFDFTFGEQTGTSGVVSVDNAGNMDTPWRVEIIGPWVNPTITHLETGDRLDLNIALGVGDVLTLDSRDESVMLGTAHRLTAVEPGSVWPTLTPGENEIRFGGSSGSGLATIYWRSAYL